MFDHNLLSQFGELPTPFYFYDLGLLKKTLGQLNGESKKHGYCVHYAIKANTNERVLGEIKSFGLGADCVSGNEIRKAIEIGFPKEQIVFAGVGKSDAEINLALDAGIFCFNCESPMELEVINGLARKKSVHARIALRINPNVNANTHHYITTGLDENKFGINIQDLDDVIKTIKGLSNIQLVGIHFHIGSQITDLSAFKNLCTRINELQLRFEKQHLILSHINVGGGLGINYHEPDKEAIPDFASFFNVFKEFLVRRPNQEVHFELGRSIVGQCCSLISRVLFIKKGIQTRFAVLDAGMTELIRPALYQSYHKIENISAQIGGDGSEPVRYDVVGPICESSDCFGKSIELPETQRGDLIAIRSAGAYGEVMASNYNLREKAPSVYKES
jgi:diaminopimelate decarboxylase